MTNYLSTKRQLQKHDGFDPVSIDSLPYYEFIQYQIELGKDLEAQRRQQEEQRQSQKDTAKPNYTKPKFKKLK